MNPSGVFALIFPKTDKDLERAIPHPANQSVSAISSALTFYFSLGELLFLIEGEINPFPLWWFADQSSLFIEGKPFNWQPQEEFTTVNRKANFLSHDEFRAGTDGLVRRSLEFKDGVLESVVVVHVVYKTPYHHRGNGLLRCRCAHNNKATDTTEKAGVKVGHNPAF